MISLLEILKREEDLVYEINKRDRNVEVLEDDIHRIENIDIDCEAKTSDIAYHMRSIERERTLRVQALMNLTNVRKELRGYIKELLEQEGKEL